MGYLKTTCTCRCDFCGGIQSFGLDEVPIEATFAKEMAERYVDMHYAECGSFFNEGDIYACTECIERAQDAIFDAQGYEGLTDGAVYEWMDANTTT